ncbi:MAG: hypothetical protein KAH23_03990 [Kiritimatiellae bacterium]|nr:hypothetical protein [Kiritimatiellia bacterium]
MFTKYSCILSICILTAGMLAAEEVEPILGFAVMRRDIAVPDSGKAPFPKPTKGAILYSPKAAGTGYLVVSPDVKGRMRMAVLPFRDEWGHATAKAWLYDALMATNTVVVKIPAALKAGYIPLQRGMKYPIISSTKTTYELAYSFHGLERKVTISSADATIELPPKPERDPRKLQEKKFEEILEDALKEQKELQEQLLKSRGNAGQVARLVTQISNAGTEKKRLLADIAKSEAMYNKFLGYESQTGETADAIGDELKKLSKKHGEMSAELKTGSVEVQGLNALYSLLTLIDTDLERIKTVVMEKKAEVTAVVDHYADENTKSEKQRGRAMIARARQKLAGYEIQIKQLEMQKEMLAKLYGEIAAFRADLETKAEDVKRLETEIKNVRADAEGGAEVAPLARKIKPKDPVMPRKDLKSDVKPIKDPKPPEDTEPEVVDEGADPAPLKMKTRVIDPLDTAAGWFIENWGDPGKLAVDIEDRLQVSVTVGNKGKLAISKQFNPGLSMGLKDTIVVDVENKLKGSVSVSFALYIGPKWLFYETKPIVVKPGKYEIYFNIGAKTFKSKASKWKHSDGFSALVFTKKLSILMYAPAAGQVFFDNLRIESAE